MSGQNPPLTCKDVKAILKKLGFQFIKQEGSHEKWRKEKGHHRWNVTVDCPKAPFSPILIDSMAAQAGVKKKDFYRIFRSL